MLQKKKDAYPNKVCNMPTRHVKKEKEKEDEKKIAHIQQK